MSESDILELSLEGKLYEADVLSLKASMTKHIAAQSGNKVRVDLSRLENVSGSILSLLLCCMRQAEQSGCDIEMTGFSQRLFDMARVGGLETVLPISNA